MAPYGMPCFETFFCPSEWEHRSGGATGIKARMAQFGGAMMGFAVAIGMCVLKVGEIGIIELPNEYSKRKDLPTPSGCKDERHCVPPGQGSWADDIWQMDGCLRLLMIMGAVVVSMELLVVMFLLPETLRPEYKTESSLWKFVQSNWRKLGTPWNNLRVFATPQLKDLMNIRIIHYVIGSGGHALFMSWYRRHNLDTFTMYTLGISAGVTGFVVLFFVTPIVERYGDLLGIWVFSTALILANGVGIALIPSSMWQLSYVLFPLFFGPGSALQGFSPELLAKLIPPDIQGTFQTGKSFLYDVQKAFMVWPWLGLLIASEKMPYPGDSLSVWVALALGVVSLWLTCKQLPADPKAIIAEGRALEAYWKTPYAQGVDSWYRYHGGQLIVDPKLRMGAVPCAWAGDMERRGVEADIIGVPTTPRLS